MNDGSGLPGGGAPAPRPHDLVGTVLAGRYRIVSRLGEGAMGAVYVGEHLRMGRRDAIKVLRGGLASDADSLNRFSRGARNLSAIRHPNVCTLYDYGETEDGAPFLALELIEGESLKEIIDREGALPVPRAVAIARQIAAALEAAHHAGIVHRDLKPGNVMIERGRDGSDIVKVVDFDIAKGPGGKSGDEVTELGFVVGTPEYMSPEQLMGERLDGRSDLYSLGLVLFRMVSGALPFRGGSTQEIMLQRLTTDPLSLSQIRAGLGGTPELQSILDRSLAREKEKRYADALEFRNDLDTVAGGRSPTAGTTVHPATAARETPETIVASSTREKPAAARPGSKRGWMVAAIAVLAVTAASLPFMLNRRGDDTGQGPIVAGPGTVTSDSSREATPPDTTNRTVPANDGTRRDGGNTGDTRSDSTPPPEPEPPKPQPPQPQPQDSRLTLANAHDVLNAQFDRFVDAGLSVPASLANAARDTASSVWALQGLSDADRALAAYVLANAYFHLRNRGECESWIRRALALDPDNRGYNALLTSCGSIGS